MPEIDEHVLLLVVEAKHELPEKMAAFEKLCTKVYGSVNNLSRGITGRPDIAQTVAQDVLIKMMHGLPKLEEPKKFFGWLRKITINVSNTRLAKEKQEREKQERFFEQTAGDSEFSEPAKTTFDEMVSQLPVEDKAIVCLKILEDLEFQDIAEITGLSVSATKMRYYRALEKVRSNLPALE